MSPIKNLIKNGARIIDVRSPEEYKGEHFKNAENIPVEEILSGAKEIGGNKNDSIVVYCASGGRSGKAAAFLASKGYTNVVNAGGLKDMPKE